MYEMKGALAGYAAPARLVADRPVPVPPVSQLHRTSLAAFPASPIRLGRFPGCPFPGRLVPSLTVSGSAGSSLTVSGSAGFPPHRFRIRRFPASPVRAVRLPVRPGAARRPPVPSTRGKYRFPGLSRAPGETPGMVPVSCGESISTPSEPRHARAGGNSF